MKTGSGQAFTNSSLRAGDFVPAPEGPGTGLFPAKLLLFGEYSVLAGSAACAFPYSRFSGGLVKAGSIKDIPVEDKESNQSMKRLLDYLVSPENQDTSQAILDLGRLTGDIAAGLAFRSNIPMNYGLGSSGALVAAVYHGYRRTNTAADLLTVRDHLAFIESAFHSRSSGTDPLVSYLNKPVFILEGEIHCPGPKLEKHPGNLSFELIDSGKPGITKSGVRAFQSGDFMTQTRRHLFKKEYIPLINSIVRQIYIGESDDLMDKILRISELQLLIFPDLFTSEMAVAAQQGIDNKKYAIKLCGSGGGGFYLKIPVGKPE